jgi:mono/diheme cytochrome c family protein
MPPRLATALVLLAVVMPAAAQNAGQQTKANAKTRGKAEYEKICGACHDLGIGTANHRTRAQWTAVVDDMAAMGAAGTKAQLQLIVDYLTANFGKPD